jgi:beta-galactosidase
MRRTVTSLNQDWLFCPRDRRTSASATGSEKDFIRVHLPHTLKEVPAACFSEKQTQFAAWYRKHLPTPPGLAGSRVFLDIDGAMLTSDVVVNGRRAGGQRGGYTGYSLDITRFLRPAAGSDNVIAIRVDGRLDPGVPPCGKVMDFQPFSGLYRDVRLRQTPDCRLEDLFVRTTHALKPRKTLLASARVRNTAATEWNGTARVSLLTLDGKLLATGAAQACHVPAGGEATLALSLENLAGITLWDLDQPRLYTARVTLFKNTKNHDQLETRTGFREAVFTPEGPFLLNGKPLRLLGLNRHQTFPYIGAAAPARLQRRDADILKHELAGNIVRTSHYPQSPHFLDRCDEIGLLVFEEIPGWGHIGDAGWKDLACRDVDAMIRRDRNHPSVVLWGVRINESPDDHDLYTRTNALARELDPSRQTGGVRWGVKSEFLEDVFTANDYSYKPPHIINDPPVTPYLVTELGSLADTRRTAGIDTLLKGALAHADVINAVFGHPKIAGAIAWCAFDYPTQDWVTIDGVQPWGVCDLFRHPKVAAGFYASQGDPRVKPVLQAVTRWKVGAQAGFDPNENLIKDGHNTPMVVFSNCDRIRLFIGDELKGEFEPARKTFPHLPHPPFLCEGLGVVWGPSWKDLRVVGLLGGKAVAEQRFPATLEADTLSMTVDDRELAADGSDMTRILLQHTDAAGHPQPHSRAAAVLTVTGPATLVGPNPCALTGGVTGLYLRAGTRPGLVRIEAISQGLKPPRPLLVRIHR